MFSLLRHCWLATLLTCTYASGYFINGLSVAWVRSRMGLMGAAVLQPFSWVPLVIGAMLLLAICRRGKVARGCTLYFVLAIPIFSALLWAEWSHALPDSRWMTVLLYFWTQAAITIPLILFWGWANQHKRFHTAAWVYPLLALIPLGVSTVLQLPSFLIEGVTEKLCIILCLQVAMAAIFYYGNHLYTLEPTRNPSGVVAIPLSIAAVMIALGCTSYFLGLSFKWQAREALPEWSAYQQFIREASPLRLRWSLVLFATSILLGTYLSFVGRKQLANVVLLWGIAAGACVWMVYSAAQGQSFKGYDSTHLAWIGLGLFQTVRMLLDVVFLELGFVALPLEKRFTAKLWVDLILDPLTVPFTTAVWWWVARSHDWLGNPPLSVLTTATVAALGLGFIGVLGLGWSLSRQKTD